MSNRGGQREGSGAKPVLTKPVMEQYLNSLERCYKLEMAAAQCGVSTDSIRVWMKRGLRAIRDDVGGEEAIYADFARRSMEKISVKMTAHIEEIERQGYPNAETGRKGDWKALAFILERVYPGMWSGFAQEFRALKKDVQELKKAKESGRA